MESSELKNFVEFLRNLRVGAGVTGLALVLRKPSSPRSAQEVYTALNREEPVDRFLYDPAADEAELLAALKGSLQAGRWALLDIRRDLSSPMIQLLNCMKEHHALESGGAGRLPESARLLALCDYEFIEHEISYPYFYKLFGPVLGM